AEDGIRDWSVTGVQTCALPISRHPLLLPRARLAPREPPSRKARDRCDPARARLPRVRLVPDGTAPPPGGVAVVPFVAATGGHLRSEERRVGKEWRARGGRREQE